MSRGVGAFGLAGLLCMVGCVRADGATALAKLPPGPAQDRLGQLWATADCQHRFGEDDAECLRVQRDGDGVVETGLSRSLHGYLLSPWTVQTHLKVRILEGEPEVYYFADGGEGGLEERQGFGIADGRTNVFCATVYETVSADFYDNDRVSQQAVDASITCVHRAVAAGPGFAEAVKRCVQPFRPAPAR